MEPLLGISFTLRSKGAPESDLFAKKLSIGKQRQMEKKPVIHLQLSRLPA